MADGVDLHVLELLCGRLCHELVSPIGAVNNGVELLDDDDPEFVKEAMALIGQSARRAGQRLQFYRFAYGTAGTSGASMPSVAELAAGVLEGGKVRAHWTPEAAALPVPWQRLACNMLLMAAESLPRGGLVQVRAAGADGGLELAAEGETATLSPEMRGVIEGADGEALSARTVHAFYTMRLAERLAARLAVSEAASTRIVLAALPEKAAKAG